MSDNIIPLIPKEYESSLKRFAESGHLSAFLDALSALGGTTLTDNRAKNIWKKKHGEAVSASPLNEFLTWLAAHEFYIEAEKGRPRGQLGESTGDDAIKESIKESVEAWKSIEAERGRYIQSKVTELGGAYEGVNSAYQFADVLLEYFDDDDPAKVISRYRRVLLPKRISSTASKVRIVNRWAQVFVRNDLADWVINRERTLCEAQKGSDDIVRSVRADCLSDQLDSIEPEWPRLVSAIAMPPEKAVLSVPLKNLGGLIGLLPYLPQAAFEQTFLFLCTALRNHKLLDQDGHGFGIFVDLATSLPLLQPFPRHHDDAHQRPPEGSYLSSIEIDIYPDQALPFVPLTLLTSLLWLVENHRGYLHSSTGDGYSLDHGLFTTVMLRARIRSAIGTLRRIKRSSAGRFSAIPEQDWYGFGFVLDKLAEYLDIEPEFLSEMCLSTDDDAYTLDESLDLIEGLTSLERREIWFVRTHRAATADGLHELANASLAYFLITQTLCGKGRFVADWSVIGEMVALAQRYPGFTYVQKAISFAHRAYSKTKDGTNPTIDSLALSGWASQSPPGEAIMQDPILDLDRRAIERRLMQDVGKKNWFKIHRSTVNQLVDAEAQWSMIHSQVGRGHKDFGSIANAFVKAIEGELGHFLKPVTSAEPYQKWKGKSEKNVTLGPMLHLLKKYSALPDDLRALIDETGAKVHENRRLMQKLFTALRLRNEGSHPVPFGVEKLAELRELLFEERLLKDFLDLLPPVSSNDS
jgi:hypothetical protein